MPSALSYHYCPGPPCFCMTTYNYLDVLLFQTIYLQKCDLVMLLV